MATHTEQIAIGLFVTVAGGLILYAITKPIEVTSNTSTPSTKNEISVERDPPPTEPPIAEPQASPNESVDLVTLLTTNLWEGYGSGCRIKFIIDGDSFKKRTIGGGLFGGDSGLAETITFLDASKIITERGFGENTYIQDPDLPNQIRHQFSSIAERSEFTYRKCASVE